MADDDLSRQNSESSSEEARQIAEKSALAKSQAEANGKRSLKTDAGDEGEVTASGGPDSRTPKVRKTKKSKGLSFELNEDQGAAGGDLLNNGNPPEDNRPASSNTYESVEDGESVEIEREDEDQAGLGEETMFNTADSSVLQNQVTGASEVQETRDATRTEQSEPALETGLATTEVQAIVPQPVAGLGLDNTVGAGTGPGDMSVAVGAPGSIPTLPPLKPLLAPSSLTGAVTGFGLEHREPKHGPGMEGSSQEEDTDRDSILESDKGE